MVILYGPAETGSLGLDETFEILLHLLESVDIDQLDAPNLTRPLRPEDPEERTPSPSSWRSRCAPWLRAWAFLQTEGYVVTGCNPQNPNRLTLTREGIELLDELQRCCSDQHSRLSNHGDTPHAPGRTRTRKRGSTTEAFAFWIPDFQMLLYRTIGVVAGWNRPAPLYRGALDEDLSADGSYAPTGYSPGA